MEMDMALIAVIVLTIVVVVATCILYIRLDPLVNTAAEYYSTALMLANTAFMVSLLIYLVVLYFVLRNGGVASYRHVFALAALAVAAIGAIFIYFWYRQHKLYYDLTNLVDGVTIVHLATAVRNGMFVMFGGAAVMIFGYLYYKFNSGYSKVAAGGAVAGGHIDDSVREKQAASIFEPGKRSLRSNY